MATMIVVPIYHNYLNDLRSIQSEKHV